LKIYIKCSIETDTYKIEDFKNGAWLTILPLETQNSSLGIKPEISKNIQIKDIDELSNQITLT